MQQEQKMAEERGIRRKNKVPAVLFLGMQLRTVGLASKDGALSKEYTGREDIL